MAKIFWGLGLTTVAMLVACSAGEGEQVGATRSPVIFGTDNRVEVGAVTDSAQQQWANATAAMVNAVQVECEAGSCSLRSRAWERVAAGLSTYPLCDGVRFKGQQAVGNCTAFLVGADVVATAGHCLNSDVCEEKRFVFGLKTDANGANEPTSVADTNVYSCKRVIQRVSQGVSSVQLDYALLELDRPVVNRTPLAYRTSGQLSSSASLLMIGHPSGLPQKLVAGGQVKRNLSSEPRFYNSLDVFGGNSGSPIIDSTTGVVEGIAVTAPGGDWSFTALGGGNFCASPRVCSDSSGCNNTFGGAMRFTGVLGAFQCDDGVKNGSETDIDCGGACGDCGVGKHCAAANDCTSTSCVAGTCAAPACDDLVRNGNEIDVDCGGDCGGCPEGRICFTHQDCQGHLSCVGGSCESMGSFNCADGMQLFRETDVDCGGGHCEPCSEGKACEFTRDCQLGLSCVSGNCTRPAFCFDGVGPSYPRPAGETDVDCGGPCAPCAEGKRCLIAENCADGLFCVGGECAPLPAMCSDNAEDISETDVDCGGNCPGCAARLRCRQNSDCATGLICAMGACRSFPAPMTCYNGAFPGWSPHGETAVDCGGPCDPCRSEGAACLAQADCANGAGLACLGLECNSVLTDLCENDRLDWQETSIDCGGPYCPACAQDSVCYRNADCAEPYACVNGFCEVPHN